MNRTAAAALVLVLLAQAAYGYEAWGFVDRTGKFVIPAQYERAKPFSDGLAAVEAKPFWGFIDRSGKTVIKPAFEVANSFHEGRSWVRYTTERQCIDKTGKKVFGRDDLLTLDRPEAAFGEGRALVQQPIAYVGYLSLFVDRAGNVVTDSAYTWAGPFSEGRAWVCVGGSGDADEYRLNGRVCYIDTSGAVVLEPEPAMTYLSRWTAPEMGFSCGRALHSGTDSRLGYIDRTGQVVVPFQYSLAHRFHEGLALVRTGDGPGGWSCIDTSGRVVFSLSQQPAGMAPMEMGRPTPISRGDFSEGMAATYDPTTKQYGYIGRTGEVLPSIYQLAGDFSEGLAAVRLDNRFGFIDKTGTMALPAVYLDALPFSEGLAAVRIDTDAPPAIQASSGQAESCYAKACTEFESKNYGEAVYHLTMARSCGLVLTPDYYKKLSLAYINLAVAHAGDSDQGVSYLNIAAGSLTEAVARWPDDYELFYGRASVYINAGNLTQALSDVNQAISLRASSAECWSLKAQICEEMGDEATAEECRARAKQCGGE